MFELNPIVCAVFSEEAIIDTGPSGSRAKSKNVVNVTGRRHQSRHYMETENRRLSRC
jgi:hypothetical protein